MSFSFRIQFSPVGNEWNDYVLKIINKKTTNRVRFTTIVIVLTKSLKFLNFNIQFKKKSGLIKSSLLPLETNTI